MELSSSDKERIQHQYDAYTTDHVSYSYYKYGILPDTEYTNNELMKVAGVLLGIGIFLLALFGVLSKKMNYKK